MASLVIASPPSSPFPLLLIALVSLGVAHASFVFPVKSFRANRAPPLAEVRHGRALLSIPDMPIMSLAPMKEDWFYYMELEVGTPSKAYRMLVETGTGHLWLLCNDTCTKDCNVEPSPPVYNMLLSETAEPTRCSSEFCQMSLAMKVTSPCPADEGARCGYDMWYADTSSSRGFFVTDYFQYHQIPNERNATAKKKLTFGCSTQVPIDLTDVSGAIGFGRSNLSLISQLAALGQVRKVFSHCLDTIKRGGIFAIGEVAEPKMNAIEPLSNEVGQNYRLYLKAINIDGKRIRAERSVVIDSGINLIYCPKNIYDELDTMVFRKHESMNTRIIDGNKCFWYTGSLDKDFPNITFQFGRNSLVVFPHDYFYKYEADVWCAGWQLTDKPDEMSEPTFILGAIALSNKLVVYDLENKGIGWTEHNCSQSIKIKDIGTERSFEVFSNIPASASRWEIESLRILLLLAALMLFI